jgi:hypothetical protein
VSHAIRVASDPNVHNRRRNEKASTGPEGPVDAMSHETRFEGGGEVGACAPAPPSKPPVDSLAQGATTGASELPFAMLPQLLTGFVVPFKRASIHEIA